jgi:hypothetical protein
VNGYPSTGGGALIPLSITSIMQMITLHVIKQKVISDRETFSIKYIYVHVTVVLQ